MPTTNHRRTHTARLTRLWLVTVCAALATILSACEQAASAQSLSSASQAQNARQAAGADTRKAAEIKLSDLSTAVLPAPTHTPTDAPRLRSTTAPPTAMPPTPAPPAPVEEIEFSGVVEAIGPTWSLSGTSVEIDGRTEIRDTINVGDHVKVRALRLSDGRLIAHWIELQDDSNDNDNGSDDRGGNGNANSGGEGGNDNSGGNDNGGGGHGSDDKP